MRQIPCPHCATRNTLQHGAAPEQHGCQSCGRRLPPDRIITCPHCRTENAITYSARPGDWRCCRCQGALDGQMAAHADQGATVLGALGGAALGARLGGPAGALIGAMVGGLLTGSRPAPETGLPIEDASLRLADWIRANYPYADPLTHIKLHSLAFYCFGIALAFGHDHPIQGISFQPWSHGPVCRPIWERFKALGGGPLPAAPCPVHGPQLPPALAHLLMDVLTIYGSLDERSLQLQVALEDPYPLALRNWQPTISRESLRAHFDHLYCRGRVQAPAYLFDIGSFTLDGITVYAFRDIHELAQALRS